jgi:AcrR family transcriptional regulator
VFSEIDRQAIKQALIEEGRKLFLRFGIKKTNVEQLVSAVGIAKGTFYHFFESKEDLCMEIFNQEEAAMAKDVEALLARHDEPMEALRAVMAYSLKYVRTDSLLTLLRQTGEYALLARGVRRNKLARHLAHDAEFVTLIMETLREKGVKCAVGPEVLAGIFRAIVLLSFHEKEIGTDIFPRAIDQIVAWVSEGITKGGVGI